MAEVAMILVVVAFALICWRVHTAAVRADEHRARAAERRRHPASTHVRLIPHTEREDTTP
jgi:hypothetical protein